MSRTINEVNLTPDIPVTIKQMFIARRALSTLLWDHNKIPIDFKEVDPELNDRELQTYIKEIIGNLGEELYEAVEEAEKFFSPTNALKKTLIELREEMADVTHFFFELFLYSGMDEYLIGELIMRALSEINWSDDLEVIVEPEQRPYIALRRIAKHNNLEKYHIRPAVNHQKYEIDFHDHYLANIQKYLNKARYELKNRPWKSRNKDTHVELYKAHLFSAFIYYAMYLEFIGIADTMIEDYLCKNIINHERIEANV